MRSQRLSALGFLVVSATYGALALRIEGTTGLSSSRMGPSAFPIALAVLGMSVSLFLVLRPSAASVSFEGDRWRTAAMVAITLLYAAGLASIGFFVSTVFFLAAGLYVLGERRPSLLAGIPLAMALASSLILRGLLGIWLPEPILRWLGGGP